MEFIKFENFDEVLNALKQIQFVDLSNNEVSEQQALNFCKEVMVILGKAEYAIYKLDPQQINLLSDTLRSIGCIPYDKVHESYRQYFPRISDSLKVAGSIDFPLAVLSGLINAETSSSFGLNINFCFDGDFDCSWGGEWLKTQGVEDPNKFYEDLENNRANEMGE